MKILSFHVFKGLLLRNTGICTLLTNSSTTVYVCTPRSIAQISFEDGIQLHREILFFVYLWTKPCFHGYIVKHPSDNQLFNCTTFVWKSKLCLAINCEICGPTHSPYSNYFMSRTWHSRSWNHFKRRAEITFPTTSGC